MLGTPPAFVLSQDQTLEFNLNDTLQYRSSLFTSLALLKVIALLAASAVFRFTPPRGSPLGFLPPTVARQVQKLPPPPQRSMILLPLYSSQGALLPLLLALALQDAAFIF